MLELKYHENPWKVVCLTSVVIGKFMIRVQSQKVFLVILCSIERIIFIVKYICTILKAYVSAWKHKCCSNTNGQVQRTTNAFVPIRNHNKVSSGRICGWSWLRRSANSEVVWRELCTHITVATYARASLSYFNF